MYAQQSPFKVQTICKSPFKRFSENGSGGTRLFDTTPVCIVKTYKVRAGISVIITTHQFETLVPFFFSSSMQIPLATHNHLNQDQPRPWFRRVFIVCNNYGLVRFLNSIEEKTLRYVQFLCFAMLRCMWSLVVRN